MSANTLRAVRHRQESDESDRDFLYLTSHDLREPLSTIAGLVTLLKRRYGDRLDETGNRWIDQAVTVARQTELKIDALVELSRAGQDVPSGEFTIDAAVEEAKRALGLLVQRSAAIFCIDVPAGAAPVFRGDASLVGQVFQNLFSNSIKYSRGTPLITVKARPHGDGFWCVAVSDNGLGFDMKFKERVFKVFQRLHTREQYPGTGVGLAIAKRIVERHRGAIWAESAPNQGATFYFTLPLATCG